MSGDRFDLPAGAPAGIALSTPPALHGEPPCVFLHASSVVMPSGAVLFLGHSTSGKSTIARILADHFPVLADDTVLLVRDHRRGWVVADGRFRVQASQFCPVWERVVERRPPPESLPRLVGCLRIHKAGSLRLEPMPAWESCRHLMDAVMEVDLQREYVSENAWSAARAPATGCVTSDDAGIGSPRRIEPSRWGCEGGRSRVRPELAAIKDRLRSSGRELEMRRLWFHLVADIARTHPGWHLWFAKDRHLETLRSTVATLSVDAGSADAAGIGPGVLERGR